MQRTQRLPSSRAGMTLIELLVVVSLMALLATVVAMAVMPHVTPAARSTCAIDARAIRAAAQAYLLQQRVCPSGVNALVEEGYVDRGSRRLDPWEGEFSLSCEGGEIDVASAGPDRVWGTEDDVRVPDNVEFGGHS